MYEKENSGRRGGMVKKMAAPRNVNPVITAACASADFTTKVIVYF